MKRVNHNLTKPERRQRRVRAKLSGTAERPRISVFRSNRFMYIQAIDDRAMNTVAAASDYHIQKGKKAVTKTEGAREAATNLAKELKAKKIVAAVFDRGQYKYHGRVKAVVEALREQGIKI